MSCAACCRLSYGLTGLQATEISEMEMPTEDELDVILGKSDAKALQKDT